MFSFSRKKNGLPDFLVVGAQKSGTTTIYSNLEKHPGIYMPPPGDGSHEIHFFDKEKNWQKGTNWYKSHFPNPSLKQGEKTPNYVSALKAHERMAKVLPNAKLILSLRNPVDRAYSQWNHYNQQVELFDGWQLVDFEQAIGDDLKRVFSRGFYCRQIQSLLEYYPREQLYICFTRDLKKNIVKEMERIYHFLGVDIIKAEFPKVHEREYPAPMNPETRMRLLEAYKPYNEELFELLGYRIPEWEE